MNNGGRTASAKTIGSLIMHRYNGVKEGPKANDIIQIMRMKHGCEISKSLTWDAREYAISLVRGIPEQSFGKILKYLHMLKEANPGTYTFYETGVDGKFRFLFISFGQSVRGFHTEHMLKEANPGTHTFYETDVDGKFRFLFVSFGQSVRKGVVGLIAKASKTYRVVDFKKRFQALCNISPPIGKYLTDADVTKWARCQVQGYKYDIRTTNPALRSPREYPVIPLLDSIREMLTRWFFE
ncbi:BnaC09g51880D [Brassica napus]|uniref:BnaC09g51880D protein n=1 Tax=Brassica napus TaxID=3708 RepID=A0A078J3Z1_BRANA|nr:BnaC09g51880D [Brassica napus]